MKRLFLMALCLTALIACEVDDVVCQPIITDTTCLEDYEHYSVCCDPEFIECEIVYGYKDPTDTGFLEEGEPNFRECGTYFECLADLDRIDDHCTIDGVGL